MTLLQTITASELQREGWVWSINRSLLMGCTVFKKDRQICVFFQDGSFMLYLPIETPFNLIFTAN